VETDVGAADFDRPGRILAVTSERTPAIPIAPAATQRVRVETRRSPSSRAAARFGIATQYPADV
jgi:hypothetical protein